MRKTISILLVLCCSISFLSCDYKTKNKISKEEYANDIARYVTINEKIDGNSGYNDKGDYYYDEKHDGYRLNNTTEYTLDKVIIEFVVSESVPIGDALARSEYHIIPMEFNYIKAKAEVAITDQEIKRQLHIDPYDSRFNIKSFKIKEIKSTALGI